MEMYQRLTEALPCHLYPARPCQHTNRQIHLLPSSPTPPHTTASLPSPEGSGPDCVCHLWLYRRWTASDQSILQSEKGPDSLATDGNVDTTIRPDGQGHTRRAAFVKKLVTVRGTERTDEMNCYKSFDKTSHDTITVDRNNFYYYFLRQNRHA